MPLIDAGLFPYKLNSLPGSLFLLSKGLRFKSSSNVNFTGLEVYSQSKLECLKDGFIGGTTYLLITASQFTSLQNEWSLISYIPFFDPNL